MSECRVLHFSRVVFGDFDGWHMVGIWLAARCPLGGLAVGHSESPDELND